jgi:hypothetical protein
MHAYGRRRRMGAGGGGQRNTSVSAGEMLKMQRTDA